MKTSGPHLFSIFRSTVLALAGSVIVGALPTNSIQAADVASTVYIPVVINLYSNSNITPGAAVDAIKEASKILEQAGLKLVVVKTNNPPGANNGDNGDGDITDAEGVALGTYGGQELTNTASGKGIKISFVRTPDTNSSTPGWSIHRDPTIVVKNRGDSTNSGQTIAHEIGHVMTLSYDYFISGTNRADTNGHAPNVAGPDGNGNIMAPSNRRNGTHLSTNQIDEIRSNRWVRGLCAKQFTNAFPAQSEQIQFAYSVGPRHNAFGPGPNPSEDFYDLYQVSLTSAADVPDLHAEIMVTGALTNNEFVNATYALGFDTDANAGTGTFYAGYEGIDRIVRINVFGNPALGTLVLNGDILDTGTGIPAPLPTQPVASVEPYTVDLDLPGHPAATTFLCDVPKSMLNLTAPIAPAVATSGQSSLIFDTLGLSFDSNRWLRGPMLQTFGTGVPSPGGPYQIGISGMTPHAPFRLMLDDIVVRNGTLGNAGEFFGTFIFPSSVPNTRPHFLYALDGSTAFGYSMTCPLVTASPTLSIGVSGDSVQLSFTVPNGYSYVVERSPTLAPAVWASWYADGGRGWPVQLSDTRAGSAQFYRVRVASPGN